MSQEPNAYSNYPRYTPEPVGADQRPPGVYFDTLGLAWGVVSRDLATWLASSLFLILFTIVGYVIVQLGSGQPIIQLDPLARPSADQQVRAAILQLVFSVVSGCISASMLAMGVRQSRGEQIAFGDLFKGFRRVGAITGLMVVVFFVVVLATILLSAFFFATGSFWVFGVGILLMLGFFVWLYPTIVFSQIRLVLTDGKLMPTMAESYRRVNRHNLGLIALFILLTFVVVLSLVFCFLPVIFAIPFVTVVIGMHYRYLFGDDNPIVTAPTQIGEMPPQ